MRSGQPRHTQPLRGQGRLQGRRGGQQGQAEVVRAGDDVDGQGVDITSGSGTEGSDVTLEGDEPDGAIRGRHSPGDGEGAPELHLVGDLEVTEVQRRSLIGDTVTPDRRQSNLVGDYNVTEAQLRSLNGSTYTAPERRQSRLAGDLQITEEHRRRAAAAGSDEYCMGVSPPPRVCRLMSIGLTSILGSNPIPRVCHMMSIVLTAWIILVYSG